MSQAKEASDSDRTPSGASETLESIVVDCDRCTFQHTDACGDCFVSFVLGREPDDALVIDAEEERAVRMLGQAGLVPGLRFEERTG